MKPREAALSVVRTLREAGFEAYFAGGCVRDRLLGRDPGDYDVATNAIPDQVQRLFRRTIAVGKQFGVIIVLVKDLEVEVATFRADASYSDGRHPDAVTFSDLRTDVLRRDFTINGMMEDPVDDRIIDLVDGRADIQARLIRAIGDPDRRFDEDRLRMLRAVRFAAQLGFRIEPATLAAATRRSAELASVSRERVKEEFDKLLAGREAVEGLRLLRSTGLLRAVDSSLAGIADPGWERAVEAIGRLGDRTPVEALSVLFSALDPSPARAAAGAAAAERGFKASNEERERVAWIVGRCDAPSRASSMRPCEWKPLLAHPGARELLRVTRALVAGGGEGEAGWAVLEERSRRGDLDPPRLVSGDDLMALGVPRGPRIGALLSAVRDAQLNGELADAGAAQAFVRRALAAGAKG